MLTAFAHCIVLHRIDGPHNHLNDTGTAQVISVEYVDDMKANAKKYGK